MFFFASDWICSGLCFVDVQEQELEVAKLKAELRKLTSYDESLHREIPVSFAHTFITTKWGSLIIVVFFCCFESLHLTLRELCCVA